MSGSGWTRLRTIALTAACAAAVVPACTRVPPPSLTDAEFWALSERLSEPAGSFSVSDNLVSNEPHVAENARRLSASGGAYIGVGPEQNYTYVARVHPSIAYIVDIRRENRTLHLFYKALFELSADRADFIARLFSRPRPAGLAEGSSVSEIFERFDPIPVSVEQLKWNAEVARKWLVETKKLPLEPNDLAWIDRLFIAFAEGGPAIQYWQTRNTEPAPSYRRLMTMPDQSGFARSFLASESDFRFVKDLHARNLIVPVIGDFGGRDALRRVGEDARARALSVTVFYGSNVGVYLTRQQAAAFCRNLAALPTAEGAIFIERDGLQRLSAKLKSCGVSR